MATILLGKDYTVSGTVANISELGYDQEGDTLDVTTRSGSKPYKHVKAGLVARTFTCTVLAENSTVFALGEERTLTIGPAGDTETFTVIVTNARRGEPKEGLVTYQLTLKPGYASATTAPV